MAASRARNRRRLLAQLKLEAGGKCQKCGYDTCLEALGFHHKDPATKVDGISKMVRYASIEACRAEAAKCVLLCGNCHTELHAGLWSLDSLNGQAGG